MKTTKRKSEKVVHAHEEQMWKVHVDVVKLNKRDNEKQKEEKESKHKSE